MASVTTMSEIICQSNDIIGVDTKKKGCVKKQHLEFPIKVTLLQTYLDCNNHHQVRFKCPLATYSETKIISLSVGLSVCQSFKQHRIVLTCLRLKAY